MKCSLLLRNVIRMHLKLTEIRKRCLYAPDSIHVKEKLYKILLEKLKKKNVFHFSYFFEITCVRIYDNSEKDTTHILQPFHLNF